VFLEETVAELLASLITRPARSLAAARPGLPQAVVDVVDRALTQKLADRWEGAREMQRAVREAYLVTYGEPLAPGPARETAPLASISIGSLRPALPSTPPVETAIAARTRAGGGRFPRRAGHLALMALLGVTILAMASVATRARALPQRAATAHAIDERGAASIAMMPSTATAKHTAPATSSIAKQTASAAPLPARPRGLPVAATPPRQRSPLDLDALYDRRH
jgi:hypothetical protein